uniref:Gelsolin-like protein 1 n=1 Tax=Schistosoma mansoni TaxID=6183 RepID=A0A5K4F7C8_SCHMA
MEEYNWKDTNMALFGSDQERFVKKESAETEKAWQQIRSIRQSTLLVWRINKFNLEVVKPDDFGTFYSGDSYIILNIEKVGNDYDYDVHFWIGKKSTQDEYVTAAYKTVELDTFLDDRAVQHREVDGLESNQFKMYFKRFKTLEGGYESGFNRAKSNEFKTRLLHFRDIDSSHVVLREVPCSKKSLNSDDVFILDLGSLVYQWNGSKSGKYERFKSGEYLLRLKGERSGRCQIQVIEENESSQELGEFLSKLPDTEITEPPKFDRGTKAVHRLSDESGEIKLSLICKDVLPRSVISQDDVYFIDNGSHLYVYIGDQCSNQEKQNALSNAHAYLKETDHPLVPISVIYGSQKMTLLNNILE